MYQLTDTNLLGKNNQELLCFLLLPHKTPPNRGVRSNPQFAAMIEEVQLLMEKQAIHQDIFICPILNVTIDLKDK